MLDHLSAAFASLSKGPEAHTPPTEVRAAARRGLALREKYGHGGLTTQEAGAQGIGSGVARARDLAAGSSVSTKTLKRMLAFFARHRKNKSGGEDDAGHIAWLLWGGDPGEAWAKRELAALEKGGTGDAPVYTADRTVTVSGVKCSVERMPGDVRHGRILQYGYGYIPDTLDADEEALDVYIGPNALAGIVYVIDQLDTDGDLDEHKVMAGFDSAEDAAMAYVSCLPRSRMGGMYSVIAGDFILWLTRNPELDGQPFGRIAQASNLRVGYFGAEYQGSAGATLVPAGQQNPS